MIIMLNHQSRTAPAPSLWNLVFLLLWNLVFYIVFFVVYVTLVFLYLLLYMRIFVFICILLASAGLSQHNSFCFCVFSFLDDWINVEILIADKYTNLDVA